MDKDLALCLENEELAQNQDLQGSIHHTRLQLVFHYNTQSSKNKSKETPKRLKNKDYRSREHLTESEVKRLREAARTLGRYGSRDSLMILLLYRHGLRLAELTGLKWDQISFDTGELHVVRLKGGIPSTHPLGTDELRALKKLQSSARSSFVFISERGAPLGNRVVQQMIARAGEEANLGFTVHPHMLRHSCGFGLASKGVDTRSIQAYLGHSNIQNTTRYTALASNRFKSFATILGA